MAEFIGAAGVDTARACVKKTPALAVCLPQNGIALTFKKPRKGQPRTPCAYLIPAVSP
jgi:hypothetical protein